jgi:hypothetical protein
MIFQMAEFMEPRELARKFWTLLRRCTPNRRHDAEY